MLKSLVSSVVAAALSVGSACAASAANVPEAGTGPIPAGKYTVDKPHTSLVFRVSHLGFSNWTARFTGLDADLQFDPAQLAASKLNVSIDPASLEHENPPPGFLATLQGTMFFDVAHFPRMTYRSTRVEPVGKNGLRITGELTLHGVTKPVVLEATYNGGYIGHPMDPHARIGFSAHGVLKRSEFGMGFGVPQPGSTMGVGDEVEFAVETEFSGPAWAGAPKAAATGAKS